MTPPPLHTCRHPLSALLVGLVQDVLVGDAAGMPRVLVGQREGARVAHRLGDVGDRAAEDVARRRRVERDRDHLRQRARQLVRRVDEVGDAVLREERRRAAVEARVEVGEEGLRRGVVEAGARVAADDRDADDGDAVVDRGEELEQAVRPREDGGRLQEQEDLALLDVLEQLAQVAEVVRVEEELKSRGCGVKQASGVCGLWVDVRGLPVQP